MGPAPLAGTGADPASKGEHAAAWAAGEAGSSWSCLEWPLPPCVAVPGMAGTGDGGSQGLSLHITPVQSQRSRGTLWAAAGALSL